MNTKTYISLSEKLRTVAGNKDIDLYKGQYLDGEKNESFNCPAVFIQFGDTPWVEQGAGVQEGDCTITFHCVVKTVLDTKNIDLYQPQKREEKLAHLTFDDAVHECLQRFTPEGCCRELWRVHSEYDQAPDQLTVTKLTYTTRLVQRIANPRYVAQSITGVQVRELTN